MSICPALRSIFLVYIINLFIFVTPLGLMRTVTNGINFINYVTMENKDNLSAEQSLKIISETMARNCRAIEKNQGSYYILWGSVLAVVSTLIYFLWNGTRNPVWNYLWFLIPVIGIPAAISISKKGSDAPKTYLHKTVGWIWCAFGITAVALTILSCTVNPFVADTDLITSLLGFTILTTGIVIKSWPIIASGALVVLLGALYTSYAGAQICLIWLFSGVIMTVGGIITRIIMR